MLESSLPLMENGVDMKYNVPKRCHAVMNSINIPSLKGQTLKLGMKSSPFPTKRIPDAFPRNLAEWLFKSEPDSKKVP